MAAGAVLNIILLFGSAFLFAGADGDVWVRWYFGTNDGIYFIIGTILLSLLVIPLARKLNIVLS